MDEVKAKEILDKIIGQIFGYKNPLSLEDFRQKYAFDIRLPVQTNDATTGEPTWTQSANPTKFITMDNARKLPINTKTSTERPLGNIQDILSAWEEINYVTSERQIDSLNVTRSDNVYGSENVFHSQDVIQSKNVVFSDGATACEFVAGSQRSNNSVYCARIEDSQNCSNSFSVAWSNKIVNSLFIQDCGDLFECMFCANISSKKFCIANIQMEEAEYYELKKEVIRWILLG